MQISRHPKTRLCLASLAIAMGLHTQAHAEDAAVAEIQSEAAKSSNSSGDGFGDIIVTAQKRAENVRDVPIAISAIGSVALRESRIVDILDVPRLAPSLKIDLGIRANMTRISIRGVGSSGGTAVEPSSASFVDGAYLPREGMVRTHFFDLESIEVLRGPQGTLFGRNASVGAISFHSAKPTSDFNGSLSAEYGTGARRKLEGFVNIPVSDDFKLRFAGRAEIFEGLYRNRLDGRRIGGVDTYAGRLTAEWNLSEALTNTTRITVGRRDGNDAHQAYELLQGSFPAGTQAGYGARFAAIGSTIDLDTYDRYVNEYNDDDLLDRTYGIVNTLSWDVGNDFTINLVSDYFDWKFSQRGTNLLSAQVPTSIQFNSARSKSHAQDLQFISPTDLLNDHLSFVAGLYYFHDKLNIGESFRFAEGFCNLVLPANSRYASCIANQNSIAGFNDFNQKTESVAAYGQATFKITPKLSTTLGARYTRDKKKGRSFETTIGDGTASDIGTIFFNKEDTPLRSNEDRFTYRANLTWRPSDETMVFATRSTGFKSGGFNSTSSTVPLGQDRLLKPETSKNTEIGMKTSLFDRRLLLDVVAFQLDVDNFQDRGYNGTTFFVTNVGSIRNRGVELDASARPIDHVRLNAGIVYLDAEFTDYAAAPQLPGITTPRTQNLKGKRPTFTPKWSGSLSADIDGDLGGTGLTWLLHGDVSYNARQNIGGVNDNNPQTFIGEYALLGARFTINGPDKRWSASIFGQNLTNHGYCTGIAYQPFGALLGVVRDGKSLLRCNTLAPPRTFGGSFTFNF